MATTTTQDLTTAPAKDIDTELARIWEEEQKYTHWLIGARNRYEDAKRRPASSGRMYRIEDAEAEVKKYEDIVRALRFEAQPFEDEYNRRGGWNRYFLVKNSNGHVHRGMNCNTCFPNTQYGWLPELSDCVEADAIEEFGELMCTVCFPDAPANPKFNGPGRRNAEAKAQRDAEKAERQAAKDAKNLAPELQFKDLGDWKVTTLAGAKTALRSCVESQTLAGTHADYNNYEQQRAPKVALIKDFALNALRTKGVTEDEIDKIIANAQKKVRKEWSL